MQNIGSKNHSILNGKHSIYTYFSGNLGKLMLNISSNFQLPLNEQPFSVSFSLDPFPLIFQKTCSHQATVYTGFLLRIWW